MKRMRSALRPRNLVTLQRTMSTTPFQINDESDLQSMLRSFTTQGATPALLLVHEGPCAQTLQQAAAVAVDCSGGIRVGSMDALQNTKLWDEMAEMARALRREPPGSSDVLGPHRHE